ncbi:P-loop containing nucleoside triphosphate hydrolase protein [Suillus ampliporus]|nr:P-loop containing nucleoside triphosphate hydrolase protein [Suillus ampliporus]
MRFSSEEGHQFCRDLLKRCMPHDTHDYQLEAIGYLLDGKDVLCITATGTGKTDAFIRLMHVICKLSEDPPLCDTKRYPPNPAMLVICPTKSLEFDMAEKMTRASLTNIVINGDTVDEARKCGRDLFKEALSGISIVLLSPKQLRSAGFRMVLDHPKFINRLSMMAVDETHLLDLWGLSFRPAYTELGWMRAQLERHVPVFAVTATMQRDSEIRVTQFLGFHPGEHHVIRHSNLRHDVQIIFHTLLSGVGGIRFPELKWTISSGRKTLIFCPSIHMAFRVHSYLLEVAIDLVDRHARIRLCNSVNSAAHNQETLDLLCDSSTPLIVVSTALLTNGVDPPGVEDVIVVPQPSTADELLQDFGRANRTRMSQDARGIVYLTKDAVKSARKVISRVTKSRGRTAHQTAAMDVSMARLILAECKTSEIDSLYDNPAVDTPCTCDSCCETTPSPPRPASCNCSGCMPESPAMDPHPEGSQSVSTRRRLKRYLNKVLRTKAVVRLVAL